MWLLFILTLTLKEPLQDVNDFIFGHLMSFFSCVIYCFKQFIVYLNVFIYSQYIETYVPCLLPHLSDFFLPNSNQSCPKLLLLLIFYVTCVWEFEQTSPNMCLVYNKPRNTVWHEDIINCPSRYFTWQKPEAGNTFLCYVVSHTPLDGTAESQPPVS